MQKSVREFIDRYLDGYEKGEIKCLDDMLLTINGNEPSALNSFSNEQLRILNELETEGILPQYLKILQEYYILYKNANLVQEDMILKFNVRKITINRFENLKTMASGTLLIKVLNFIDKQKNL